MNAIFISFVFFISVNVFSQTDTSLVRKWRIIELSDDEIIELSDDEMFWNAKKDSVSFSDTMEEFFISDKDSINAAGLLKLVFGELFRNGIMIFEKDGTFKEYEGDSLVEKGSYTVDKQKKIIKKTIIRNNKTINLTDEYFYITGNELHIAIKDEVHKFNMIYEKIN